MSSIYKITNTKHHCSCKELNKSEEIQYQCSIDGSCKDCRKIDKWYDLIKINNNWYSFDDKYYYIINMALKRDKITCCFVSDSQNDLCEECDSPTFSEYCITKIDNNEELAEDNVKHCVNLLMDKLNKDMVKKYKNSTMYKESQNSYYSDKILEKCPYTGMMTVQPSYHSVNIDIEKTIKKANNKMHKTLDYGKRKGK